MGTPTGFKFNNFSYSNIATPTTPLNATKIAYPMNTTHNTLHHTAAMNNIYAMNAARIGAMNATMAIKEQQITTKLNGNAIPYQPNSINNGNGKEMKSQQLEHQK